MSRPESPLTPLMKALENATALDGAVKAIQPALDAVTGNPAVRSVLQGRQAGHSAHPILVMLPLGTWLSALLLDVVGSDEDAAEVLTLAGLATVAPAVATGLAELADASDREKRVGLVHAACNVVGVALQAASYAERRRGHRVCATGLAGAAMSVVGAAGYLGGHLSVARKLGSRDVAYED